ncbi:FadR/GntR family transcriptional regulator [Mycolicibacterium goodii]|uniref:FadR family transcriptional regulator n=1 Tax=Mycolicibacterium goodii TaxID=134601 RepID=A0ABS6HZG3_MYCGD|nr:FadR/GntR family transcriptional regulator [Mycolicibacterium goodii]MBU8827696.1 FadR family transcriptional regulator [Mycolicibacterium goodii]MBU8841483.1 FadR family transcriptional regulator [Mycolicibacterium goodii]
MAKFTRPLSVTETVFNHFRGLIADGALSPGEKLPSEPKLAQQFSVGRSTVREAIQGLELAGLIVTVQGQGTFVAEGAEAVIRPYRWASAPTPEIKQALQEARLVLETAMAELAASRATDEDIRAMKAAQCVHASCTDLGVASGYSFHLTIAMGAHNEVLLHSYQSTSDIYHRVYSEEAEEMFPKRHDAMSSEHRAIVEAIENRDPAGARAAMIAHLVGPI